VSNRICPKDPHGKEYEKLHLSAARQDKRSRRGERGKEMRGEREGIDDFSPFAFPSSLFTKCSLWFEECCALDF